jgi:hypothetical protein
MQDSTCCMPLPHAESPYSHDAARAYASLSWQGPDAMTGFRKMRQPRAAFPAPRLRVASSQAVLPCRDGSR